MAEQKNYLQQKTEKQTLDGTQTVQCYCLYGKIY